MVVGACPSAFLFVDLSQFDYSDTRLSACCEVYSGMVDATRKIVAARGVRGLYQGLGVTLVEILPYSAITFGVYDYLNALCDERRVSGRK